MFCQIYPYPGFREQFWIGLISVLQNRLAIRGRDKDDFKFPPVKVIANDDLVTITCECFPRLGYQQRLVCLELEKQQRRERAISFSLRGSRQRGK